MPERFDAVVIGAGIVGTSTALHLLMRGKKVLLIDRRSPGEETSYGNAGIMEAAHVLPFGFPPLSRWLNIALNRDPMARIDYSSLHRNLPWIFRFFLQSQPEPRQKNGKKIRPLILKALEEHHQLMQDTDAAKHWQPVGRASLYRTQKSFDADALSRFVASEVGVPFDVMDTATFQLLEPDVKPVYIKAVRWLSTARITNPSALVKAYAGRFTRQGGAFLQTQVKQIEKLDKNWHVDTLNGLIETQDVILCMGPWTCDIAKQLGYHFPLGFKRGYHRHFPALGSAKLSHALSDATYGYALTPMEQGYRIATGAEFADRDAPPHPDQLDLILPLARDLFPLGEALEANPWMGNRPCFTDSLPVIGPAPRHKGLWFNFGHGHVGLTIGPASGRLLTELLIGAAPFCDPSPYRADRFNC